MLKVIFKEISYRRVRAVIVILSLLSVLALLTFIQTTSRASIRTMQILMKNMGQNIVIIPNETDRLNYYTVTKDIPLFSQEIAGKIAFNKTVSANYYLGCLDKRLLLNDEKQVIISGKMEYKGVNQKPGAKNPFTPVAKGTVRLGSDAARIMNGRAITRRTI